VSKISQQSVHVCGSCRDGNKTAETEGKKTKTKSYNEMKIFADVNIKRISTHSTTHEPSVAFMKQK